MDTGKPKGVDDLLAAGGKPIVLTAEEALKEIEQVAGPESSDDPVEKVLADVADWPDLLRTDILRRLATLSETNLQRLLAEVKSRGGAKVVSTAKLEKLVRQERARRAAEERGLEVLPGGGDPEASGKRYIADRFPPAAEIIPPNFPFPESGKRSYYDIRGNRVVLVEVERDGDGEREIVTPVTSTVVLLARHLAPVEPDAAIEKWRVAWWQRARWEQRDIAARYLFDRRKVAELVDTGLPVTSETVDGLVAWLGALRDMALLGHQDAPELPTVRAVSRCGWHELDGERFFVVGREILRPSGATAADAGDRDEIQPDAGGQTDQDVRWAEDLSAMERQILSSFRCGGDPEAHRRFLLEVAAKYPQVAFALGCAAGAPLLRFARAAGLIDVEGFSVLMVPRAGGRSRHQGKSTWNVVIASLYGWPATGPEGRLRFADRTRVAAGVLFATNCDLTVHVEELQHLARASKKESAQELAHLIYQVASGMDRERGARGGGGRRTRGFHTVLFGTAETDVTVNLPVGSGAHDRVLKLPPLLEEESDANRGESERLTQAALTYYGHVGRKYLSHLVRLAAEGTLEARVTEEVRDALDLLRENLPADSRRASAGRIASRAAVGLAGLALLLEALEASEEEARKCGESFFAGWEMVLDGIPAETVDEAALAAVQSYVVANAEQIENLRTEDPERPRPPVRWVGSLTEVKDDDGNKVVVVALTEPAFAEAVAREPFGLDPQHALQALVAAGYVVIRTEKKPDGRTAVRTKLKVRVAKALARCVCLRRETVLPQDSPTAAAPAAAAKGGDAPPADDPLGVIESPF